MITILHGDNTVQSRKKLVTLFEGARGKNLDITRLEAKSLSEAQLEMVLGSNDLFDQEKMIVIEELHSLPTSARKKTLIDLVAKTTLDLVLWEKRALTATMLKKFPNAKVEEFKTSNTLFKWLENLGGSLDTAKKLQLLHQSVVADGDYFCFLMLIRQIRQLIQVKSGGKIAGPPFMQTKLQHQAAGFTLLQLKALYKQLLDLDYRQKTSRTLLSLAHELDLLTLRL